jgi:hypothetical protein
MNFEHNDYTNGLVAQAHYIATKYIAATEERHRRWEMDALKLASRRMTDRTASWFVPHVGKHRNYRYWTQAALDLANSGQSVAGQLTGDHAIEVKMLVSYFVETVREGLTVDEAAEWLASHITIVTMLNAEDRRYGLGKRHPFTIEQLVADPFARYPEELRRTIRDLASERTGIERPAHHVTRGN